MKGDERIFVDFEPNDFVIRVTPVLDAEDTWSGDLKVGYMTLDENYLNDSDYQHIDFFVQHTVFHYQYIKHRRVFNHRHTRSRANVCRKEVRC